MAQMPLFGSERETVLVDDARGRIVYTPAFLPVDTARAWFAEVLGHFRLEPPEDRTPEVIRGPAALLLLTAHAVRPTGSAPRAVRGLAAIPRENPATRGASRPAAAARAGP